MTSIPIPPADFVLVDKDGNAIARRRSLGILRNYARMSSAGSKYGVAIIAPDGTTHPVRTPRPA